jgi:hypothetical protein
MIIMDKQSKKYSSRCEVMKRNLKARNFNLTPGTTRLQKLDRVVT